MLEDRLAGPPEIEPEKAAQGAGRESAEKPRGSGAGLTGEPVSGLQLEGTASVGFVPTMGALHAGHLSLVRAANAANEIVAASIFVNPLQFGPSEDFARYPRTFAADCALLEEAGVDVLFAPEPAEMYPGGFATAIDVGPVATRLDGASRPGHFTGVSTVVAKLFLIVQPERAYFGQKDAAQVAVLRQMVRDLALPVELVACAIVRDHDGLALSSRNQYLSGTQRREALVLSRSLEAARGVVLQDEHGAEAVLASARAVLDGEPGFRLDYLALVDPATLEPVRHAAGALLAVAGWVGTTRLIDNVLF
ncbi:pantoate--beta-alanine ligase [Acidipila sp. EB88]|nr:pantoate--beta-alanine ligase [Acidipila sp. EB88]